MRSLSRLLLFGACVAFLDAGSLAAEVAKIIQLSTADLTTTDDIDVIDDSRVQREDALNTDAEAYLADGNGLADASVLTGDADALKGLEAFLVAFLDADVDTQRIARLKRRNAVLNLCVLNNIESIHFIFGQRSDRKFVVARFSFLVLWFLTRNQKLQIRNYSIPLSPFSPCSRSFRTAFVFSSAFSRRHFSISAWLPLSKTSGTVRPRNSAGRV
jgi:hypothetical protein